jgi:hypothetical protein
MIIVNTKMILRRNKHRPTAPLKPDQPNITDVFHVYFFSGSFLYLRLSYINNGWITNNIKNLQTKAAIYNINTFNMSLKCN